MKIKDIKNIVNKQLALDYNFREEELKSKKNIFTSNELIEGRRVYRKNKDFLKILAINNLAIFSGDSLIMPWIKEKFNNYDGEWIFSYYALKRVDQKLMEYGQEIHNTRHYYIPNPNFPKVSSKLNIKWFEKDEILQFKDDERFGQAFEFSEIHPDVLAVAAMDGNKIMGMAGASADSKTMWQIGIDVIPEYRGRGIAANLVSLLKDEILSRGIVPFYGTSESHNYSKNVAINSGFFPFWAEASSRKCK
ncbi:GNAT family N-acetyltransferase [Sedimentibacter sp. zth1]|uniref:GNAT family N-acetyltransferase n=1 Tax=Sedimentibacter sp. zth1 TaxID=2816908 RepID=UPI001A90DD53|nr:GNAT family N-acetyltransferase [Sedimentibacter sp. zth1]QSX05121.1 GNAT family N-acetyltransferase [Sedimentibacter sp. zth1]